MQDCKTLQSEAVNFERQASISEDPLSQTYFNGWCLENEICNNWAHINGQQLLGCQRHLELAATAGGEKGYFVLQLLNVVGFVICMTMNGLSPKIMPASLREISTQYGIKLQPAGFAFAIWGLIYLLLLIFVVYQALPSSLVPGRNDQLIFDQIGYTFFANMLINGLWLILFQMNTKWGFLLGLIDIIAMLYTNFMMMMFSTRSKVNAWEFVSMRVGFSIYAGWVTSATILNFVYNAKAFGVEIFNEESYSIFIVWAAFVAYNAVTYVERNPIYGAIFIWTTHCINKNLQTKDDDEKLRSQNKIVFMAQSATTLGLTGYFLFTSGENGLFY